MLGEQGYDPPRTNMGFIEGCSVATVPSFSMADAAEVVRSAATRREQLKAILQQGREEQISQCASMTANDCIIQESIRKHIIGPEQMCSQRGFSREDEQLWENARLHTKVATLESDNNVLKYRMRQMLTQIAELKSQAVCTTSLCKSQQARVQAVSSQRVAKLEVQVDQQQSTLDDMSNAAQALASENYDLSTQLLGLQDEKQVSTRNAEALEEQVTTLQELYLRNLEASYGYSNPTIHSEMQSRCLDELATKEVLESSRPPSDFPIPEAPAIAKIRPALQEIKALRVGRNKLQAQVKSLSEQVELLCQENKKLSRCAVRERNTAKETASLHQSRMVGMLRRLQYLVQEMKNQSYTIREKDGYIRKLEAQLVAEHRKFRGMSKNRPKSVAKQIKPSRSKKTPHRQGIPQEVRGSKGSWTQQPVSLSSQAQAKTESGAKDLQTPASATSGGPNSLGTSDSIMQGPRDILASIEEVERLLKILDKDVKTGDDHGPITKNSNLDSHQLEQQNLRVTRASSRIHSKSASSSEESSPANAQREGSSTSELCSTEKLSKDTEHSKHIVFDLETLSQQSTLVKSTQSRVSDSELPQDSCPKLSTSNGSREDSSRITHATSFDQRSGVTPNKNLPQSTSKSISGDEFGPDDLAESGCGSKTNTMQEQRPLQELDEWGISTNIEQDCVPRNRLKISKSPQSNFVPERGQNLAFHYHPVTTSDAQPRNSSRACDIWRPSNPTARLYNAMLSRRSQMMESSYIDGIEARYVGPPGPTIRKTD